MNPQEVTNRPRDLRLESERAKTIRDKYNMQRYQLARFGRVVACVIFVVVIIGAMVVSRHPARTETFQSMGDFDGVRK